MNDNEYINNDMESGIAYDWRLIAKRYKALKCPKDVFSPLTIPYGRAKLHVVLSDRSRGKTTNLILFGMCMHEEYGTVIQYIRSTESQIAPKNTRQIFDTILEHDYIAKVTHGKYNSVTYKSRAWYYCNTDSDGTVLDVAPTHFMFMLSVDKNEDYKSSYNAPKGDFIIYDEFIRRAYPPNEFIQFLDLLKTIIRDRQSAQVIFSANTINKHHGYFNELEIYDDIQKISKGSNEILTTSKGTNIYVALLPDMEDGSERAQKRKANNLLYFGFNNPLISSITGADTWSLSEYPHIPESDSRSTLSREIYIEHNNKLVNLEIVSDDTIGIYVLVHWASYTYDDSYIYTLGYIKDSRYHFKLGDDKISSTLWKMYKQNRFYYASNDVGAFVENYINQASYLRR